MPRKRPDDFSVTFGMRPFGSWERAHVHRPAAASFDYLVCTPDGRVSIVYWAPLPQPFDERVDDRKKHRKDQSPDKLLERRLVISSDVLDGLWLAVSKLKLRPGLVQYFDYSDPTNPEFFVRAFYQGKDRILRAMGYPLRIEEVQDVVCQIVQQSLKTGGEETESMDDPQSVIETQRAQWSVDWHSDAFDSKGNVVKPVHVVKERGGAILR